MNWREKLADWISGGSLSKLKIESDFNRNWSNRHYEMWEKSRLQGLLYRDHLRAIAAEAKRGKNPNATVRRLGKMAEEALK